MKILNVKIKTEKDLWAIYEKTGDTKDFSNALKESNRINSMALKRQKCFPFMKDLYGVENE